MRNLNIILCILLSELLSSCSLFFGNIRSVEEKSKQYSIQDPNLSHSHWKKVESTQDSELPEGARADISFESIKTSAVISLTSACKSQSSEVKSLTEQTHTLLLGVSDLKLELVRQTQVDRAQALWSSVSGKMSQSPVQLEIVAFQRGSCTYDLVLAGSPTLSVDEQEDFSQFVSTFHFK
jgi:hypothetical protein